VSYISVADSTGLSSFV